MSDDPWARYADQPKSAAPATTPSASSPPAPADDPWARYTGSAPAAPTASAAPQPDTATTSSYDPNWKGTGNAMLDFLTRPRAKTEGFIPAATDAGLSFSDALSFGQIPKALGAQQQTAQAHANLGLIDPLVQGMGYAAGPGKILGPLARGVVGTAAPALTEAGAPLAARIGGSMAAGGLEGTAAGGLGAAGHGGDIGQGAIMGALTGTAAGAFGGSGPVPKAPEVGAPVPLTPGSLYAKKAAAYAPADSIYFDPQDVRAGIGQGHSVISTLRDPQGQGADLGISPDVNKIVNDLSNSTAFTGRNIQQASSDLRATGDWTGHRYADGLDSVLNTAQPKSINGVPTGQVGEAGAAIAKGDDLWGRIKDIKRLTPDDGSSPTLNAIKQTRPFYDKGTPEDQALGNLQDASGPGLNWWHLRHPLGIVGGEGAALAAEAYDPNHQSPWMHVLPHAVTAAALFSGAPAALSAAGRLGQGSALNAAKYAIGTGQPISTATGRVGNTLLDLMLGRAATNQRSPA